MATQEEMIDALKTVIDPELMVNIVDLGLVYDVKQEDESAIMEMTLTSPSCPAGPQIVQQAKTALESLEDITTAEITLTMTPQWTPEKMTEDARDQLGMVPGTARQHCRRLRGARGCTVNRPLCRSGTWSL